MQLLLHSDIEDKKDTLYISKASILFMFEITLKQNNKLTSYIPTVRREIDAASSLLKSGNERVF